MTDLARLTDRPLVVVTWPGFDDGDPDTAGLLRSAGLEIRFAPSDRPRTTTEVGELVADATAAIVSTDPFDRSVFERARRLRVVARTGVGIDSIDVGAATEAGVLVTTTPGANDETCADHTLAILLAAIRRVVENDRSIRRGQWDRAGELTPWDLHGKRVGIVGFGRIGRAVARRLEGFGARIMVCDPAIESDGTIELVELDELLALADVVSLHLPLLPETRHLLGRGEIARMRPGAILVNTARGGLVDEDSLAEALATGRLRAAALDVFDDEPLRSSRLLELPNVVLTPHIGGLSVDSIRAVTVQATKAVVEVLSGRLPDGVVNPAALDRRLE